MTLDEALTKFDLRDGFMVIPRRSDGSPDYPFRALYHTEALAEAAIAADMAEKAPYRIREDYHIMPASFITSADPLDDEPEAE